MNSGKDNATRRDFLKAGLATSVMGLAGTGWGLRQPLAESASTSKPVLNQQTIDALIPRDRARHHAMAQEVQKDFKAFVRNHFTLTPAQEKGLDAMAPSEVTKFLDAINTAVRKNYRVKVNVHIPAVQKVSEATSVWAGEAMAAEGWTVGDVTVGGDASYSSGGDFSATITISVSC